MFDLAGENRYLSLGVMTSCDPSCPSTVNIWLIIRRTLYASSFHILRRLDIVER